VDDFGFGLSLEPGHIIGTAGNAQTAADTALPIYDRYPILFRDGAYLAAIDTRPTAEAFLRINDRVVVGISH
jgi:hypothetical protein